MMTPDEVTAMVHARPWAGQPGAQDLVTAFPSRLRSTLAHWRLEVVRAYPAGAGIPALEVVRRGEQGGSRPAVLKFGDQGADVAQQARVLEAAAGQGYVRLLDHDPQRGAILLERLGETLGATVPEPVRQVELLGELLLQAWELPLAAGAPFRPGQKASSLLTLVDDALAAPEVRHQAVLERGRELALELAARPSSRQVVVHGDPHPGNALARVGARRKSEAYALIDPDGFCGEPEYDAGVVLRDHRELIDELDRSEGAGAGRRRHADLVVRLSRQLELDPERVAAWAHLERVTTGIYLGMLGWHDEGEAWLRTAQRVLL